MLSGCNLYCQVEQKSRVVIVAEAGSKYVSKNICDML